MAEKNSILLENSILTPQQVAALFQVSVCSVKRWLKDGSLKGFRLPNSHWRVPSDAVRGLLKTEGDPQSNGR